MESIPVFNILIASFAALCGALLFFLLAKKCPSGRFLLLTICSSVFLTALSLFVSYGDYSGTGWRMQYGWPHQFYTTWTSFEGEVRRGFVWGPWYVYVISNSVFYFSFLSLLVAVRKFIGSLKK